MQNPDSPEYTTQSALTNCVPAARVWKLDWLNRIAVMVMKAPENAVPGGYWTLKLCAPKLNTLSELGLSGKVMDCCAPASATAPEQSTIGTTIKMMEPNVRWQR